MLALGSAVYMVALAIAQAVIALRGHALVALGWGVGAITFVLVTWLGADELFRRVELGLVASSLALVVRLRPRTAIPTAQRRRAIGSIGDRGHHRHAARRLSLSSISCGGLVGLDLQVVGDHHLDQARGTSTSGSQPSFVRALVGSPISRSTSDGRKNFGSWRTYDAPVLDTDLAERQAHELLDAVCLAGGDDVVVGLVLLQHQPHRLHVVAGIAPVALGVEVAEHDLVSADRA